MAWPRAARRLAMVGSNQAYKRPALGDEALPRPLPSLAPRCISVIILIGPALGALSP